MPKIKEKKLKSEIFVVEQKVETPIAEERPKLGLFSLEFGREDLNKLRDKLNEVIEFVNK